MNRLAIRIVFATALFTATAFPQAKNAAHARNVILFIGDGGGVTSVNAASIYGYGKPQALYIQSMPNVGLADTSTAMEWVTGADAAATAMATGKKGRNGVISMSFDDGKGAKEGTAYKTVLEYAEEKGLSTGLIENNKEGVLYEMVSAFYSHAGLGNEELDIYHQFLKPRFGDGPDVVLATNFQKLNDQVPGGIEAMSAEFKAKGYAFAHTMSEVASLDPNKKRVIGMFDGDNWDMTEAVKLAVARLSKNPKGFFLVVHSDCHLGKTRASLVRLVDLDKAIRAAGEGNKSKDTLMIYTADHGYALYIKGEKATEAMKSADQKRITDAIHLEDTHTAEEVPVMAMGPGSGRVKGYMSNTDIFHVIMAGYGWNE